MPHALSESIQENRLLLYTSNKSTQEENELTRLGGSLIKKNDNEYRVIIQNTDASKLDYYLDREVDIETLTCSPNPTTQVTIYLKNRVVNAQDLPAYVLTRADKGKPKELVTGQHRFKVFIYGPYKSQLIGGSLGSGKDGNAAISKIGLEFLELHIDDLRDLIFRQLPENHRLIYAVQKLRFEMSSQNINHRGTRLFLITFSGLNFMSRKVTSHYQDRVLEIDHAALRIRQPAIV